MQGYSELRRAGIQVMYDRLLEIESKLDAHEKKCVEREVAIENRLVKLETNVDNLLDVYRSIRAGMWTLVGAMILTGGGLVFAMVRLSAGP